MSKVLYKLILNTCTREKDSKEMVSSKLIHSFILIYLIKMSGELNVMFIMAIED